jgi:hypothetical protein
MPTKRKTSEPIKVSAPIRPLKIAGLKRMLENVIKGKGNSLPFYSRLPVQEGTTDSKFIAKLKRCGIEVELIVGGAEQLETSDQIDKGGCWQWDEKHSRSYKDGTKRPQNMRIDGPPISPYRAIYATYRRRAINENNDIDHQCRNPMCVRPGEGHCIPLPRGKHADLEEVRRQILTFNADSAELKTAPVPRGLIPTTSTQLLPNYRPLKATKPKPRKRAS